MWLLKNCYENSISLEYIFGVQWLLSKSYCVQAYFTAIYSQYDLYAVYIHQRNANLYNICRLEWTGGSLFVIYNPNKIPEEKGLCHISMVCKFH